nr:anaphase-promoting complex subunit 10-like [Ipomoea batatas]
MFFQLVVLYVDFKLDESYTPSKISIRAGDGFHNLKESHSTSTIPVHLNRVHYLLYCEVKLRRTSTCFNVTKQLIQGC